MADCYTLFAVRTTSRRILPLSPLWSVHALLPGGDGTRTIVQRVWTDETTGTARTLRRIVAKSAIQRRAGSRKRPESKSSGRLRDPARRSHAQFQHARKFAALGHHLAEASWR